jgi:hypothetical protein
VFGLDLDLVQVRSTRFSVDLELLDYFFRYLGVFVIIVDLPLELASLPLVL